MRALAVVIGVVCLPSVGLAQSTTDARLWLGAGVGARLGTDVRLEAEQELRLGADAGFDETHTQLAVAWRLSRPVRIGALYRLIVLDGETRHRLGGEVEARAVSGKLAVGGRLRLQDTIRPNDDDQLLVRTRGKLEYRLSKRVEPFGALELHHQLSPKAEYREVRLYLGVTWQLAKKLDLATFYMFQTESNVGMPETNHVFAVGLTYQLGNLRKGARRPRE